MKRFILISGLGLMIGMFNINKSEAQVHISINIDIQPAWGPSGYDYAEYYYIPELNIYYDVINRFFYYQERDRWIRTLYLPVAYSYYDFYSLYKVVLNNILNPWRYNGNHRHLYHRYCYNYHQIPIYCMNDHRYYRARNNCHRWVEPHYMPKNDGRPRSRDYTVNTRNGRISNDLRSSRANEALRNNRSSVGSRESSNVRNDRSSASPRNPTSRSSRTETGISRSTDVSHTSRPATENSRSSESRTGNPGSTYLKTPGSNNASSTPTSRSSAPSVNNSRSSSSGTSSPGVSTRSSSRNSSPGVSTRSSERSNSGSTVRSSSRSSNSRSSESATKQGENSNRSERKDSRGR